MAQLAESLKDLLANPWCARDRRLGRDPVDPQLDSPSPSDFAHAKLQLAPSISKPACLGAPKLRPGGGLTGDHIGGAGRDLQPPNGPHSRPHRGRVVGEPLHQQNHLRSSRQGVPAVGHGHRASVVRPSVGGDQGAVDAGNGSHDSERSPGCLQGGPLLNVEFEVSVEPLGRPHRLGQGVDLGALGGQGGGEGPIVVIAESEVALSQLADHGSAAQTAESETVRLLSQEVHDQQRVAELLPALANQPGDLDGPDNSDHPVKPPRAGDRVSVRPEHQSGEIRPSTVRRPEQVPDRVHMNLQTGRLHLLLNPASGLSVGLGKKAPGEPGLIRLDHLGELHQLAPEPVLVRVLKADHDDAGDRSSRGPACAAPDANGTMAEMPTRADAIELLFETTTTDSLRRHGLALEAVMRQAARRVGGDEEEWAIAGLLHDFDYEAHPQEHPFWGRPVLESRGYSAEVVRAIQGHATFSGVNRDTEMARWLFALDELTGFVMAVALVQPGKVLSAVKPSSVRKKLKDKAFARSVLREDIALGSEELEIGIEELVELVVAGLAPIAAELGLGSGQ